MKRLAFIGLLFTLGLLAGVASAQNSTISGNVTDSSGTVWTGARVVANFVPTPNFTGNYTWNGGVYKTFPPVVTTTDGSGNFTLTVQTSTSIIPAQSKWSITVCPLAGTVCSTTTAVSIPAGTYSATGIILTAVGVGPQLNPTFIQYGYNDAEILPMPGIGQVYYRSSDNSFRQWNGTSWVAIGGGGTCPGCLQASPTTSQTWTQEANTNATIVTSGTGQINLTSAATETLSATNGVTINGVQFTQLNGVNLSINSSMVNNRVLNIAATPFLAFGLDANGTSEDTMLLAGNSNSGSDTTSNFLIQAPNDICIQGGQAAGIPSSPNVGTCGNLLLGYNFTEIYAHNGNTTLTLQQAAFGQGGNADIFNIYTSPDATPSSTKILAVVATTGSPGASGQLKAWNGTALKPVCLQDGTYCPSSGGGTPGGSNYQVQYNNAGAFGGLSLGTTNQVLHGNASGLATWSAVSLSGDVTGNLPFSSLTTLSANQILGALTATTPSGLSVPSCSTSTSALTWTSGTGFGCNTITPGTGTVTSSGSPASGNIAAFTTGTNIAPASSANMIAAFGSQSAYTFFGNGTGSSATPTFMSAGTALMALGSGTVPTGSGALVLATSPTLVTPALGVATATSINGVPLTSTGSSSNCLTAAGTYVSCGSGSTVANQTLAVGAVTVPAATGTGTAITPGCYTGLSTLSVTGVTTTTGVLYTPQGDVTSISGIGLVFFVPILTSGTVTTKLCTNSTTSVTLGSSSNWTVSLSNKGLI